MLAETCDNILLWRITTIDNEFDGIAWDGVITNSIIAECTARANQFAGISFDIGPEGNLIVDTQVIDNGQSGEHGPGIFMRESRRNIFANCFIARNLEDGIFLGQDPDTPPVSENLFDGLIIVDNGGHGINQAGEGNCTNVLDGVIFCGNALGAIAELPACPLIKDGITECP